MVLSYAQNLIPMPNMPIRLIAYLPDGFLWMLEGSLYFILAGIPAALLLWVLWKKNRKGMEQREEKRILNPDLCNQVISAKAYLPLLAAMPFVFANYAATATVLFMTP